MKILSDDKQVAVDVANGRLDFGWTNSDDALIEFERATPVEIVYPDQAPGELGTLFIPNTVAIIKGGPHPAAARRLVDFLLSPTVEEQLAKGEGGQIPLNSAVTVKPRVQTPKTVRPMKVDFQQAAAQWDDAIQFLRGEFGGGSSRD